MLGKLLKYEFKASGRILLPLYGAMIVLGLISALFMKVPHGTIDNMKFLGIISIIVLVLYIMIIFSSFVLSWFIAIYRFKKNLFDREGYLMNTLPVTASQNIMSKAIVAVVYQILSVAAAAISGLMYLLVFYHALNINWGEIMQELSLLLQRLDGSFYVYLIEGIVFALASAFCGNLMIYAAISIGHSFNGKKVAKSILAYIVLYFVSQIISFNFVTVIVRVMGTNFSSLQPGKMFLLGIILLQIVYCVIYFFITRYFLKNKLNLQ